MEKANYLLKIYRGLRESGYLVKVAISIPIEKLNALTLSSPMEETSRIALGKFLPEEVQVMGPVVEAERILSVINYLG